MMQLVYLNMTNVTKDQKAFDNMKNTYTTSSCQQEQQS